MKLFLIIDLTHPEGEVDPNQGSHEPLSVTQGSPSWSYDTGLPTYRMASSQDGDVIASLPGFYNRTAYKTWGNLTVLDKTGKLRFQYPLNNSSNVNPFISEWTAQDNGIDVTKDGTLIAAGLNSGNIMVFDTTGKQLWNYTGSNDVNPLIPGSLGKGIIFSSEVDFSSDGAKLAAGTLTGMADVFDAKTGSKLLTFNTMGQVRALRFLKDGSLLVGSGDNHLYKVDSSGKLIWKADLTFWPWENIAVSNDESLIVTGGKDGILRIFDANGNLLWSKTYLGYVHSFTIGNNNVIYVMNGTTGIYAYDSKGNQIWYYKDLLGIGKIHLSPNEQYLSFGRGQNNDRGIVVLETKTGTPYWQFILPTVSVSPTNIVKQDPTGNAGSTIPNSPVNPGTMKPMAMAAGFFNATIANDGSIIADSTAGNIYYFKSVLALSLPLPTIADPISTSISSNKNSLSLTQTKGSSQVNSRFIILISIVILIVFLLSIGILYSKRQSIKALLKSRL